MGLCRALATVRQLADRHFLGRLHSQRDCLGQAARIPHSNLTGGLTLLTRRLDLR